MNKKQLINEITEHFPSVYTKEDVVKLINMLDDTQPTVDVELLKSKIRSKIERLSGEDVVNYDDIDLSIYGREIQVDDVPVNYDTILDEINEVIDDMFVHDEE